MGKPRENHGKPWENHGKTMGEWWFDGILSDLPSGKRWQKYGQSPFRMEKSTISGHFSSFLIVIYVSLPEGDATVDGCEILITSQSNGKHPIIECQPSLWFKDFETIHRTTDCNLKGSLWSNSNYNVSFCNPGSNSTYLLLWKPWVDEYGKTSGHGGKDVSLSNGFWILLNTGVGNPGCHKELPWLRMFETWHPQ